MKTPKQKPEMAWVLSNLIAQQTDKIQRDDLISIIKDLGLANNLCNKTIDNLWVEQTQKVSRFYTELIKFINNEIYNNRIILYLPTEWIPKKDHSFSNVVDDFRKCYKKAWFELLKQDDIRANFFDGDVPEKEYQIEPLPLVVKAAHLLPFVLEKSITTFKEVLDFVEKENNEILLNSIIDTIPYLVHLKLITPIDLRTSKISTIRNSVYIFNEVLEIENSDEEVDLNFIFETIKNKYTLLLNTNYSLKQKNTQKRVDWLNKSKLEEIIRLGAEDIYQCFVLNQINPNGLNLILLNENEICVFATLYGLSSYIELNKIQDFSLVKKEVLDFLIKNRNIYGNQTYSAAMRLFNNDFFLEKDLLEIGFKPKNLFDFKIDKDYIQKKVVRVQKLFEESKKVKACLEKCFIVYGSTAKGHNSLDADIDIAFFSKPGINKIQVIEVEKEILSTLGKNDYLFFIINDDGSITQNNLFSKQGNDTMAHVFFNGIWSGEDVSMDILKNKILNFYTNTKNQNLYKGYNAKEIWLSEIERDILQYRLMHKGYEQHHNVINHLPKLICKDMDPLSSFWDYGYRRLATMLFIKKVTL